MKRRNKKINIAKTLIAFILIVFQCALSCAQPVRIGTTYSPVQSGYLGLDWKKTYLSVLNQGFDIIRLGAYWNEIEKEEDIYDFSSLDWQIREARKKRIPVVLTVGMKAPRWPEYFIPDWVLEKTKLPFGADVSSDEFLRKRTLKFIEKVVNHYKNELIIKYWQVENEPLNRFGENYFVIGKDFLKEEVELVRSLDEKNRPIVLTAATYPNPWLRFTSSFSISHDPIEESLKLCDILGLNVYPVVGHKFWWMNLYFSSSRKERDVYFSGLLSYIKSEGKDAWIVELQAEPWEPGQLVHKKEELPPMGQPEMIREFFHEFRSLGFDTILLWGAEYWNFRQEQHGDKKWNKLVADLMNTP